MSVSSFRFLYALYQAHFKASNTKRPYIGRPNAMDPVFAMYSVHLCDSVYVCICGIDFPVHDVAVVCGLLLCVDADGG